MVENIYVIMNEIILIFLQEEIFYQQMKFINLQY